MTASITYIIYRKDTMISHIILTFFLLCKGYAAIPVASGVSTRITNNGEKPTKNIPLPICIYWKVDIWI